MKPVARDEVLELGAYEPIRDRFLERVIAEKRSRRVRVCEIVSAIFENRDTVLLQIQEMLRTERITKEASILHEIATYNELIPGVDELSATMFVEIVDHTERDAKLGELAGLESCIALDVGGTRVRARNETKGTLVHRTTAVHYLKFPLGAELAAAWRAAAAGPDAAGFARFVLDHPKLSASSALDPIVVRALADDLA